MSAKYKLRDLEVFPQGTFSHNHGTLILTTCDGIRHYFIFKDNEKIGDELIALGEGIKEGNIVKSFSRLSSDVRVHETNGDAPTSP